MAEDFELPVWGVRPNWSDPVVETLEWSSDVLASDSGAEQRLAYRLAPRRLIEARFNPFDNERTFTDLALHRLGRNEWMMPLFFDSVRLAIDAAAGSSRLDFATEFHEFAAGGMAYLVGPDCFSGEAVRISALDADGIDLEIPLNANWPAGTVIHPMRRGRFESPSGRLITSRVSELRARFEIIQGNDLSDEGEWDTESGGIAVLTAQPEWSDAIDIDLSWLGDEFDSESGLKHVVDPAGRAFRQQQHAFILQGAQEQFEFRQLLYRLRGRQQPIWLPSMGDDFTVAVAKASGVTQIDVEKVGFAYVGGPTDGRDRILLLDGQVARINAAADIPNARERLTLAAPTTAPLPLATRLSFVETCRLAADSIEIEHLGDTDGVARSTLAFVAFANRRTATTATSGIPEAEMNETPCDGTPPPEYEGWDHEWLFEVIDNQIGAGTAPSLAFLSMNYPGEGGVYNWNSGQCPTCAVFKRESVRIDTKHWTQYWKMARDRPLGAYTCSFDPTNNPGNQTYRWYVRRWNELEFTLLQEVTSSGAGTKVFNHTFE